LRGCCRGCVSISQRVCRRRPPWILGSMRPRGHRRPPAAPPRTPLPATPAATTPAAERPPGRATADARDQVTPAARAADATNKRLQPGLQRARGPSDPAWATAGAHGQTTPDATTKRPRPAECGPRYQATPADTATTRGHWLPRPADTATKRPAVPHRRHHKVTPGAVTRQHHPCGARTNARSRSEVRRCHTPRLALALAHTRHAKPTPNRVGSLLTPSQRPTFQRTDARRWSLSSVRELVVFATVCDIAAAV